MREKCSYLELLWSAFTRIRTEYGAQRDTPYLRVQSESGKMQTKITPNTDAFYALIGKTINQDKTNYVIGITTSNNKTHTAESIQKILRQQKENVTESKDHTSSNNDLKHNPKHVCILGDSIVKHIKRYDI